MKQPINQKEKFTRWDFFLWAMLVGFLVIVVFLVHPLQLKSRDNDPNIIEEQMAKIEEYRVLQKKLQRIRKDL